MRPGLTTYEPLNTLKPVATDVWIADGPVIRFGPRGLKMPFSTRMTLIRLPGDALFIHSPTPLVATLAQEIGAIGRPAWLIGPNRLHYWWIPQWHSAFPEARAYVAPRVLEQAAGRLDFATAPLDCDRGYPWDEQIATLPVAGSYMTEVVFFHRASRTLVLTDLIENFERERLHSPLMRLLTKLGGVLDPDGRMPYDMRLTFRKRKPELRAAVERMIEWNPQRILLAHGRWYAHGGVEELRRAFRWIIG